jgi:hypothetical protein
MRRLLLFLTALSSSLAFGADAAPSTAEMKDKLHAVIRQQLEAFRQNDYEKAYVFATDGIRSQFPLSAFEKMVRTGYPLIAHSTEVVFGIALDDGERAVVSVRITAGSESALYQYLLERNGDEWRIAGVEKVDEKKALI